MAQHDMNIANQGFPATRADLNNALQALATNSSGTSAPSTTFANQWWYDTTNNKLYIRNEANNAWIQVAVLDQTNNEWQITTGQISAGDSDGLVFKTDDGNTRITLSDGGDVTFADGTDVITASAGTDNVRIGEGAGDSIASGGNQNVLIGKDAGTAITTGDDNIAVGYQALDANTTGGNSIAVGSNALGAQTTGDRNIGIGTSAGAAITTGQGSIAIGHEALASATTGDDNVAIGADSPTVNAALEANTTGLQNVAVGGGALAANTTANEGTAVGYKALEAVTTGFGNTALGGNAGKAVTTTDRSTFLGNLAGSTTTGRANTFLGSDSGYLVTSGAKNTILGRFNGNQGGLDIRTSDNQIVLSDGSGTPHGGYNILVHSSYPHWNFNSATNAYFATSVRHSGTAPYGLNVTFTGSAPNNTAREFIFCNDTSASRFTVFANGTVNNATGTYSSYSDQKLKENIADSGSQWDDIKAVRVRKYSLKADDLDEPNQIGVIAQELEASGMNGLVYESFDKDEDGLPSEVTTKSVKYSILYMKAVKALQEAMDRIETLETKVAALEAE